MNPIKSGIADLVNPSGAVTFGEIMDQKDHISRWLLAIILWGMGFSLARFGYEKQQFTWMVGGLFLALIGVLPVIVQIIHLAAKPFTAIIDAIIFPRVSGGKPNPNYKLIEYYEEEGRLADAESEYRTILRYHKRESPAYRGLIKLLMERGETEAAGKVLEKARRHLKDEPNALFHVESVWAELEGELPVDQESASQS